MPKASKPRIAIIGAGLGGTAAATLLHRAGFDVNAYEQAPSFSRLGAGIHLSPNVTRVLRALGLESEMRRIGLQPAAFTSKLWDTGEKTLDLRLGDEAEARYGAPYMIMHRGDFQELLVSTVPARTIQFDRRLTGLTPKASTVDLTFHNGERVEADLVIGADGVNSRVREILLGPEPPLYTGYIAHRSIFPTSRLGGLQLDDCTKWWSPDRHIVIYFLTRRRDEIYFVSGVPCTDWPAGTVSMPGDVTQLRRDFEGFEPRVQAVLSACTEVSNWAIMERNPLPLWSRDRIVLLGDACHPMRPHMGQGAAMAIEDAAMLARCFEAIDPADYRRVFERYEANRIARTTRVQQTSHIDAEWLRKDTNPDWVFGYDVFTEPLL